MSRNRALAALCVVFTAQVQAQTVVPGAYEDVPGPRFNRFPFDTRVLRYQQAYDAAELTPLLGQEIFSIAFRRDDMFNTFVPTTDLDFAIELSTGDDLVDSLSTTLDTNTGSDAVTVFDGVYTITNPATGSPAPFDILIEFSTPFLYTGGDLLVDFVTGTDQGVTFELDAVMVVGDGVSRAYEFSPGAPSPAADTTGVITAFNIPAPGAFAVFGVGGLLAVRRRR